MALAVSKVIIVDGVQIPVQQFSGSWTADGGAAFNLVVPYSEAVSRLQSGSQVHVYHVAQPGVYRKRKTVEVGEDESGFRDRRASLGTVQGVSGQPGSREELDIIESFPLYALQYMVGGELTQKSSTKRAQGSRSVTLHVEGYHHLWGRMSAIQLTRGRGTLNAAERRILGQSEAVFTSTGRRGFANDLNAFIGEHPDNMLGALHRVISRYAGRLSPFWSRRFYQTRAGEQLVYYEGDTTVNRLFGTNAFTRFLREQTQQMYTVPLPQLIVVLLAFVQYRMVALPFPAYFPAYVPDPPEFEDVVTGERVRQRGGGLFLEITWPGLDTYTFPEELPEFVRRTGRLEVRGQDRFWTWEDALQGEEQSVRMIPVNFRALRRERADLIENGLLGRWTVPQGAFLEGTEVFFFIESLFSASDLAERQVSLSYSRPDGRLTRFREGDVFAFRGRLPPNVAALDRVFGEAISRAFSLRLEVKRSPVRTVTEPIIERRQIPRSPVDGDVPRGKDVLASYAFVPYLWWAAAPACNVIIPEMITQDSEVFPGLNRLTRLMGKISPGRSGSSRVRGDQFLAPRDRDLQTEFETTNSDPRDFDAWAQHEIASGPVPDIYYFELLHRLVRDSDWETYLQSYIQQEFWSRRLAPRTMNLELAHTYHIAPGFPAVVILSADAEDRSPQYRALSARLSALQDALRQLRACLNRFRDPPNAAETLRRYIANLLSIRLAVEKFGGPPEGPDINSRPIRPDILGNNLRRETTELNTPESRNRYFDQLGGLPGGQAFNVAPSAITPELVRRHISDPAAVVLAPVDGLRASLERFPTESELRRWFRQIREAASFANCRQALRDDIADVMAAIEATRAALRRYGAGAGPQVVIGYVESVTASAPRDRMTVALTHCRYLGEDISEDLLDNDDLENVIAFGPDGFMDDAYRSSEIGTKVYPGILGCESVVEVAAELDEASNDDLLIEVDGLRTDIQDVIDAFRHPAVCGRTCVTPGEVRAGTSGNAARALYEEYRRRKQAGAGSSELLQWILRIQHRAPLLFSDAYRGTDVTLGAAARKAPVVEDLRRDDREVYEDGVAVEGFFARSFLNPTDPEGSMQSLQDALQDSTLSDQEKTYLTQRTQAALDYLSSLAEGALTS